VVVVPSRTVEERGDESLAIAGARVVLLEHRVRRCGCTHGPHARTATSPGARVPVNPSATVPRVRSRRRALRASLAPFGGPRQNPWLSWIARVLLGHAADARDRDEPLAAAIDRVVVVAVPDGHPSARPPRRAHAPPGPEAPALAVGERAGVV
jgi:hypothetical protein